MRQGHLPIDMEREMRVEDSLGKIRQAFERAGGKALVAYITAGDPDFKRSLSVAEELISAGVDVLELGVPFSDPMADGVANQLAACRALESGMTPARVLDLAAEISSRHPQVPIVLFTYLNPVAYSGGFDEFCRKAAGSGVTALLLLDLPPEEQDEYRGAIDAAGLGLVSLVAPTTPEDRIAELAANASAFIYYVSREGVTGEGDSFSADFAAKIAEIRKGCRLPVVVGFGISTPEHAAKAAATGVDGVVVGSAIVRKVEAWAKGEGSLEDIGLFAAELKKSLA